MRLAGRGWIYQSLKVKWLQIALVSVGFCGMSFGQELPTQQQSPAKTKVLIQEWVKTERLISEESKAWSIEQEQLKELMGLYETEISLIQQELEAAGEVTTSLDEKTEQLKKKAALFEQERSALKGRLKKQRVRLLRMVSHFPQPLQQQIERETVTLEAEDSTLRENASAMLQVVKAAGQFNRTVSYSEEMQSVGTAGEKRQLRVLYLGLARAYYLSGDTAGTGQPAAGGWKWAVNDEIRPAVKKAIAVFQKTARPELVILPVEVQN